jgi:nucleoside-diphosphate-sugar epimerase
MNRVADNRLAMRLMGWEPRVSLKEGLHRTIDWFYSTKDPQEVAQRLQSSLTER